MNKLERKIRKARLKMTVKEKAELAFGLDVVAFVIVLLIFANTSNGAFMCLLSLILLGIGIDMYKAYMFIKSLKDRKWLLKKHLGLVI